MFSCLENAWNLEEDFVSQLYGALWHFERLGSHEVGETSHAPLNTASSLWSRACPPKWGWRENSPDFA